VAQLLVGKLLTADSSGATRSNLEQVRSACAVEVTGLYFDQDGQRQLDRHGSDGLVEQLVDRRLPFQLAGLVPFHALTLDRIRPVVRLRHAAQEAMRGGAEIAQAEGLRMSRFLGSNYRLLRDIKSEDPGRREGMSAAVAELLTILTPPGASIEDQLRVRFALLSIKMLGMAARDLDADEEDILTAAARISTVLLPSGF
jgi:hypothetical protein